MSVNCTTYIMWGLKLPYPKDQDDDWQEEKLDPYEPSFHDKSSAPLNLKNDTSVILDGYGCDYLVVGHIIDRTHGHDGSLSQCPLVLPNSPGFSSTGEEIANYAAWMTGITATLEDIEINADGHEAHWMVIQHYT